MIKHDVHVLIVDEQEQARAALGGLLSTSGYHVSAAEGRLSAGALLEQQYFDLMIAEAQLSGPGSGPPWELLADLPEPPELIVLTGRPSLDLLPDRFHAGVFLALEKEHGKGYGDGHSLIEKVLQQAKAKLEEAQITALGTVNDGDPAFEVRQCAQVDEP